MNKTLYKTNQNNPVVKAYKDAVKKGMENQHVLPHGNEWVVKKAGSTRITQSFNTQAEASKYAKSVAENQGTAVFVHGTDGRIRERTDY